MKKLTAVLLSLLLVLGCFSLSACSKQESGSSTEAPDTETLKIVTTIFPVYDWVREITKGNDNVEITMLIDKGADLHSYQPTAEDLIKIARADAFIYVGGESDKWAEDALKNKQRPLQKDINLLEALGDNAKEEELKEGMQGEEEEAEADAEEGPEYDEHVWLSVRNAQILVNNIAINLGQADEAHKALYTKNAEAYTEELNKLDNEFMAAIDASKVRTLLFGDRFPFRYLAEDYGLDYFAAFVGCSAESEASFETVSFLAKKVDELGLQSVAAIEGTDHKLAETIVQNTKDKNQKIVVFDSMQSKTLDDVKAGVTYLSVMRENLKAVQQALQ